MRWKVEDWPGRTTYDRFLAWLTPAGLEPLSQQAGILRNLVNMSLLAGLIAPVFIAVYAVLDAWILAFPLLGATAVMLGAPLIYKCTRNLTLSRELFLGSLFLFKAWETCVFHGVVSPGTYWFIAAPVGAVLLGSARSGLVWLLVSIAALIGLQLWFGNNVSFSQLPVRHPYFLYTFSLAGLFVAIAVFVLIVETARRNAYQKLEQAKATIHDLAIRDGLTGVFNRRHVWEEIAAEERRAAQQAPGFCIALIDLDHFKRVNDTFGHAVGDQVLKRVAGAIQREVRAGDCFGRYGGEEFILLFKNADLEGGRQLAERIRRQVEAQAPEDLPGQARTTVSIGLAEHLPGEAFNQTIDRADKALYAAKSAGRNCVRTGTESGHA